MPGTGEPTVRQATAADIKPLAMVMARAFYADPPFMWILPNAATRLERNRRFFVTVSREALPRGGVDVVLVDNQIAGAAIWLPPGPGSSRTSSSRTGDQVRVLAGLARAFGRRIGAAMAISTAMSRVHPREPHWYLFAIGIDPSRQGTGLASELLRPRLAECDRAGMPAYLEASKPASVPLYQHFGFERSGDMELPAGAPPLTPMWRPAAGGTAAS
jgi:GNAT superfamily N-acetyltransferase